MNHLDRYKQQLSNLVFVAIFLPGVLGLATYVLLDEVFRASFLVTVITAVAVFLVLETVTYLIAVKKITEPTEKIWQAIMHIQPEKANTTPPRLDGKGIGKDLVSTVVLQIYNLASGTEKTINKTQTGSDNLLAELMPTPLLNLDKDRLIVAANTAASSYLGLPVEKIIGKHVYDVLHLSFMTNDTFENWLNTVAEKRATDTKAWEHVRITLDDSKTTKQLDMSASYSKDNQSGSEVTLVLFDKSATYGELDKNASYIALAVHELRTPLTMLRGYIEVFEEEIGPTLNPELKQFMRKMSVSAQSLAAFVNNILNVSRIDEGGFNLSLHEADWSQTVKNIIKDLDQRASVRGKNIKLEVAPDLPTVAIDAINVYEVMSNLIDNAIKYGGDSKDIVVKVSSTKEGTVDTTVQDFGVGIPESAIKGLFTKYYRSHRSKDAVSGNGLGLYLVKSIITAHGGSVWVNSKPGEGSTFGFSLQTFASASANTKPSGDGIERHASGWIRNHSLYRR